MNDQSQVFQASNSEFQKWRRAEDELRAAVTLLDDPLTPSVLAGSHIIRALKLLLETLRKKEIADGGLLEEFESETRLHFANTADESVHIIRAIEESIRDATKAGPKEGVLRRTTKLLRKKMEGLEPTLASSSSLKRARTWTWLKFAGLTVLALLTLWEIRGRPNPGKGKWHAMYYPTRSFSGEPTFRRDKDISFDWAETRPSFGIRRDTFSTRWNSCLVLEKATKFAFQVTSTSGTRLFVNGDKLIDEWKNKGRKASAKEIKLPAGTHHIRMEYKQRKKKDQVYLRASISGEKPKPLPEKWLRYPGDPVPEDSPCSKIRE